MPEEEGSDGQAAGIEGLHIRGLRATAATRLQEGGASYLDEDDFYIGGRPALTFGISGDQFLEHEALETIVIACRPVEVVAGGWKRWWESYLTLRAVRAVAFEA